jgi:hypothetical protein
MFLSLICLVLCTSMPRANEADAQQEIQKAIERGVAYLKSIQNRDGAYAHPLNGTTATFQKNHPAVGSTALAGLTLLECKVPANDAAVQKAADAIRLASTQVTFTYSVALSILFLDRLGDPKDFALIESLTVRLLAGQNAAGGWTYNCPAPDAREVARIQEFLKKRTPPPMRDGKPILTKEVVDQLTALARVPPPPATVEDNSNTQFAALALWVARRHGLPVDAALLRIEARFRATQHRNGGWSYIPGVDALPATFSMTCAGLIGLGIGRGVRGEGGAEKLARFGDDRSVRGGLMYLALAVGHPVGKHDHLKKGNIGRYADFYFLWSVERVATAYGLDTIGKKDWYAWGAKLLLPAQLRDGSWGGPPDGVNTCFALLFLSRANLAKDLTAILKTQVEDPGEAELKGTGEIPLGDKLRDKLAEQDDFDTEVIQLAEQLVRTPAREKAQVIARYKDNKGVLFTQALASAIPRLEGKIKDQARDALVERLTRMTANTLRAKLADADVEVRAAAALACGTKEDVQHVPDLIPLLRDNQDRVVQAAHVALRTLVGKDLGKEPEPWQSWWEEQAK